MKKEWPVMEENERWSYSVEIICACKCDQVAGLFWIYIISPLSYNLRGELVSNSTGNKKANLGHFLKIDNWENNAFIYR